MSEHHHGTAPEPRRFPWLRFGKSKPRPTDPKLGGGTKVGCCGHCVGAPRPGQPAGK